MMTSSDLPARIPDQSKLFRIFGAGLAIVLLSLWLPFIPDWLTFVHVWRVELFASVFLFIVLALILVRGEKADWSDLFSWEERRFIIYPIVALVFWSALSGIWAESWRSAVHHSLVWAEYLIFYCIVRHFLNTDGHYRKLLGILSGVLFLYALPAISGYVAIMFFGGANTLGVRFSRFGEQVIMILPLLIVGTIINWKKDRWLGLTAIAGLWLLLLCSMSRANIFLALVVTILITITVPAIQRYRRYAAKLAVVIVVLASCSVLLNVPSLLPTGQATPIAGRFSDSASLADSNGFRKLMAALSLEMIVDRPITGIGADNFGFQVHRYRESFAATNPDNVLLTYAENEIPERAHNEYLQIVAELGFIGGAIFLWFLAGIGLIGWRAVTTLGRRPLIAPAAAIGLVGFLAAGLVTSFSFRLIQNGFVFFFVLAVAAKALTKDKTKTRDARNPGFSIPLRPACAVGICVCLSLAIYSSVRVASVIVQERASFTADPETAHALYGQAMRFDPENPTALSSRGMRLFRDQKFSEAIPFLSTSISMGLNSSTSYSYLASAQLLAGDSAGAEDTMRRAALIYPRSVFVLVRHSVLLNENGQESESATAFEKASGLNPRAAAAWRTLITEGADKVSRNATPSNSESMQVMDLLPRSAMFAVMSERLIRHPEERRLSLFQPVN